jgi:hypothetical protein
VAVALLAPMAAGAEPAPVRIPAPTVPGQPGDVMYLDLPGGLRVQAAPPRADQPWTNMQPGAGFYTQFQPSAWGTKEKVTFLGVATTPASEILADQLRLPRGTGLVVDFVRPDSPAGKAGVKPHDILLRLDDQILVNPPQLAVLVRLHKPGDKVAVTLLREGKEEEVPAELGETEMVVAESPEFLPGQPFRQGRDTLWRMRPEHLTDEIFVPDVLSGYGATFSDNEHNLTLTLRNGAKYLEAKDKAGKVVFQGPVQTDEQKKSVPPEILKKLARMEVVTKGEGQLRINNGVYDLTVSTDDCKRHLVAKDAKSGKVLFDGPIDTEEQLGAVPKDIREKLKAMGPSIITVPNSGPSPM